MLLLGPASQESPPPTSAWLGSALGLQGSGGTAPRCLILMRFIDPTQGLGGSSRNMLVDIPPLTSNCWA